MTNAGKLSANAVVNTERVKREFRCMTIPFLNLAGTLCVSDVIDLELLGVRLMRHFNVCR